jgi:hypothetical protein
VEVAAVKRTRLRPVSDKRRAARSDAEPVVQSVFARDQVCILGPIYRVGYFVSAYDTPDRVEILAALRAVGPCGGRWRTPHHLRKEGQGGTWAHENIVTLCSAHNRWVEDEPDHAHALGLVIRAGESYTDAWAAMRRASIPAGPEHDPATGGLL